MASPTKRVKSEYSEGEDSVSGYIHNVSAVKVGVRTRGKFFNALLQVTREQFCHVVVFSVDKRAIFIQAEKNKTAVKLLRIKRRFNTSGEDYDVQCNKFTEVVVVSNIGFSCMQPPRCATKSVAEVKAMTARQQVGMMEVKVCHVQLATKMVEMRGATVEVQTCYVQDASGLIKVRLWEEQIGALVFNRCYRLRQLSTREYLGSLFLTTTRDTEIEEVNDLPGADAFPEFESEEEEVRMFVGSFLRAEIAVCKRCTKCKAWQSDFQSSAKFHRCQRCRFLQKMESFESCFSGRVALQGGDEMDLTVSNSVLRSYLKSEGLLQLIVDGKNVEEHLLCGEAWQVQIQNDAVVALEKVQGGGVKAAPSGMDEDVAAAISVMESVSS